MTTNRVPENLLTVMEPVACTECGETMPVGTVAWIPGWGQIAHWYSVGGCDAYDDEDEAWDDLDDEEDA